MDFGTACIIVLPIAFFSYPAYVWISGAIENRRTRTDRMLREVNGILDYLTYRDGCYVEDKEPSTMCEYFIENDLYTEYRNHTKRLKKCNV